MREVDLLIGEPYYSHFVTGKHEMGKLSEPGRVHTVFGHILCGAQQANKDLVPHALVTSTPEDITFLWELDQAGLEEDESLTVEEKAANDFMIANTEFNEKAKRYFTRLPWKVNPKEYLQDNYERARAIALSTLRRNNKHKELILQAFDQLEENGFAEEVPENEINNKDNFVYYLEVHAVMKLDRTTTKARLVMNASAKDAVSKRSLNSCLLTGQNLINEIPSILLKFRLHKEAVAFDISNMFRNIFLQSADRDATRFLRPMPDGKNVKVMRHTSLPFGLTSSPYQSLFVLKQHMDKIAQGHPELREMIDTIQKSIYVDDTVVSLPNKKDVEKLLSAMEKVFLSCGMKCHKFCSTDEKLLKKHIGPSELLGSDKTTVRSTQDLQRGQRRVAY